jgi:hypothetical protein
MVTGCVKKMMMNACSNESEFVFSKYGYVHILLVQGLRSNIPYVPHRRSVPQCGRSNPLHDSSIPDCGLDCEPSKMDGIMMNVHPLLFILLVDSKTPCSIICRMKSLKQSFCF